MYGLVHEFFVVDILRIRNIKQHGIGVVQSEARQLSLFSHLKHDTWIKHVYYVATPRIEIGVIFSSSNLGDVRARARSGLKILT